MHQIFSFHNLVTIIILHTISPTSCLANDFIKTSCVTRYPEICYETLSSYATTVKTNPNDLACAALSVTLKEAKYTSMLVMNMSTWHDLGPREAGAVKDCVENMRDCVDELEESLKEMKGIEGPDFDVKMSNVMTWVSAALTDEDTCMDGFEGDGFVREVKESVRVCIVRVSQLTSIALALINQLR